MKKLGIVLFVLFALHVSLRADHDKPVTAKDLPVDARVFIHKHFPKELISWIKLDQGLFSKDYNVYFESGNSIEFDKNGVWTKIQCIASKVPEFVVPVKILNYVKRHHSAGSVVSIERHSKKYEVKLSNGLELKFDQNFNLIKVDD